MWGKSVLAYRSVSIGLYAGDAETWSSAMQRLLCSCHASLDVAFLGMDDTALAAAGKAGLDPQAQPISHAFHTTLSNGNVPAGRLGAQHGKQSVHSVSAVQKALGSLAGLLDALERMLTASYPVAVPLPSHGILMLLTRILTMDDSARQAGETHTCMHPARPTPCTKP